MDVPQTTGGDSADPVFKVERVELQFSVAADFVAAQVANNVLILALQTGRIMRVDWDAHEDIDDIDLPKKASEIGVIRRLFLDPTASHLIISTTLGENYYLHAQTRQPKPLSRLRGVVVESVSWNPSQPTSSTREILVGAADGNIYETYIELSNEFYRREEKYVKTVYRTEGAVSGIWTDSLGKGDIRRVVVATPRRLLHFVGKIGRHGQEGSGSIFSKLFESEAPFVQEAEGGPGSPVSSLSFTPDGPDSPGMESVGPERIFSWLNPNGVMYGRLRTSPMSNELGPLLFSEAKTLPSSKVAAKLNDRAQVRPSLAALTQWHILLFLGDRVVALNRLDESVIFEQRVVDAGHKPLALLADMKKNTFWLFTSRDFFEIVPKDEDRDVWKIMLQAEKFDEALQYANNPLQKDAVATASGDHLMKKGKYIEAADVYGKSSKAFEEVALDFIDKNQKDALRRYLLAKLASLRKSATMQRIMLASWLTEVFMAKLNSLDDTMMTKTETTQGKVPDDVQHQLTAVRREFQEFTRRYKDDLDRKTVYDIISSHGREEELLYYSTTIDDYNYVLSYWIQRENWTEALKALSKQSNPEVTYKYSSVLMAHVPLEFVEILMRQSNLEPRQLIPAFLTYNAITTSPIHQNQAVRYLLFEINQRSSTDAAVHNTLLSIYAASPSRDEAALLNYLESQSPTMITTNKVEVLKELPYDADFALRLCIQHERIRSCVHIYSTMGQYASAVELALQHQENELAIAVAERPEHDAALRKKLWIAIARSVITSTPPSTKTEIISASSSTSPPAKATAKARQTSDTASISSALSLLRRAPPGVLRIEDLLPLFPDFVTIDAFKDEIISALSSYSSHIDTLKAEMDDSAETATRIKSEVGQLGKRWVLLEPGESCAVCGEVLLERRFWVWHCGHGVHGDCLADEVVRKAPRSVSKRVRELRVSLEERSGLEGKKRERTVAEMEELLGRECVFCGEMAVRMIDEPFVSGKESANEWAL